MPTRRRLPGALDGRLVTTLAKASPGAEGNAVDWGELRRRGRPEVNWDSLIVSAAVHVTVVLLLSVWITSVDLVDVTMLLAELSTDPQELLVESLASGPGRVAEVQLEAAVIEAVRPSDPFEQAEVSAPQLADFEVIDLAADVRPMLPVPAEWTQGLPAERQPRRQAASAQGNERSEEWPPAATYFGTAAEGDRFVYILDMSSSMNLSSSEPTSTAATRSGTRFERAAAELLRSISQLKPDQSFYVVLFSNQMRPMFDDETPHMLPATAENQQRLREWITAIEPLGSTRPRDAIRLAISLAPSAIFMLSDGEFDDFNATDRGDLFDADPLIGDLIGGENREKVPIHSFAFEVQEAQANMKSLASQTGGQFRFIQPARPEEPRRPSPPKTVPTTLSQKRPLPQIQTPAEMLAAADALNDSGQYQEALKAYQELIRRYPLTPAAVQARGRIIQINARRGNNRWSPR